MADLIDNVRLNVDASRANVSGLELTERKLRALDTSLKMIQGRLASFSTNTAFKLTAKQFEQQTREMGFAKGSLSVAQVAKRLGLPETKDVQRFARELASVAEKEIGRLQQKLDKLPPSGSAARGSTRARDSLRQQIEALRQSSMFADPLGSVLKNPRQAGMFLEQYSKTALKQSIEAKKNLLGFLSGAQAVGRSGARGQVSGAAAGPVALTIPAAQIVATLGPGMVSLLVPAVSVVGQASSLSAGTKTAGTAVPLAVAPAATGLLAQEKITTIGKPITKRKIIEGVGRTIEQLIKETDVVGETKTTNFVKRRAAAVKRTLEKIEADLKAEIEKQLALPPKQQSLSNIAALGQKAADQARGMLAGRGGAELRKMGLSGGVERAAGRLEGLGTSAADQLQAEMFAGMKRVGQLRQSIASAQARQDRAAERELQKELTALRQSQASLNRYFSATDRANKAVEKERAKTGAQAQQQADALVRRQATYTAAHQAMEDFEASGGKVIRSAGPPGGAPNRFTLQRDTGKNRETMTVQFGDTEAKVQKITRALTAADKASGMFARGLRGLTLPGFAQNLLSVTGWTAAVTALYAPIRLVSYSLDRMIEVGLQTARLGQVFRGVGGNAQELRNDILQSASAMGRETDEAMAASIAWSRLGLTRQQVAEAVRVSLMGANVAEMSAAETTEHLSAVTAVYRLRVSELEGVLGMLNQTSNTARVTNADLLIGLSNVAAVGKEAGFSLAELQGILGASVEVSGQSGSRMGNAMKNILTRLGRPDVQSFLQNQTGVEVMTPDGGEKSRAEILREIVIAYQRLNAEERTNLAGRVAGAHQANRFAAIMDSYVRGQMLAVDAQLNLNSAQNENARILATLKSQLAGLRAEWDALAVGSELDKSLAKLAGGLKSTLRFANQFGPSAKRIDVSTAARTELEQAARLPMFGNKHPQYFEANEKLAQQWMQRRQQKGQQTGFWRAVFESDKNGDMLSRLSAAAQTPFERNDGTFRNKLQELKSRGSARTDQARLFDTVAQILRTALPENAARAAATIAPSFGAQRGEFAAADRPTQIRMLQAAKARASAESVGIAKEASDEVAKRFAEGKARAAELEATIERLANTPAGGPGAPARQAQMEQARVAAEKELRDLKVQLADLDEQSVVALQKYVDLEEDAASSDAKVLRLRQAALGVLQEQDDILDSIGRRYAQMRPATETGALDLEAEMLRNQLRELQAQQNNPVFKFLPAQEQAAAAEKIRNLEARLQSAESPGRRATIAQEQRNREAVEQGRRELTPFNVGTNDGERLLNQQLALEEKIAALRARWEQGGLFEEDRAELVSHENQLYEVQQQILDRNYGVQRDINQLVLERRKEFERSFATAGPAEMLRKLAAFRSSFDNQGNLRSTSQGAYFAMAPAMRQEVNQINPQFDPQRRDLVRERERLEANAEAEFQRRRRETVGQTGGTPVPLNIETTVAQKALDSLGSVSGATSTALMDLGVQVMGLRDKLAALNFGGLPLPALPQGGGVGGGKGF